MNSSMSGGEKAMATKPEESSGAEIDLQTSDPAVQKLVADWKDGGTYTVKITQVSSGGGSVKLRFEECCEDEGEMESEDEAPVAPEPKVKVQYKK